MKTKQVYDFTQNETSDSDALRTSLPFSQAPIVLRYICCAFICVSAFNQCRSDEERWASDDQVRECEFILRGVQAAREKLVRGVVRFTGVFMAKKIAKHPDIESVPIEMLCAFDFERGFLRFDVKDVGYGRSISSGELTKDNVGEFLQSDTDPSVELLRSTRNREYFAWYESVRVGEDNMDTSLAVRPRSENWSGGMLSQYHITDVRSIGLLDFFEFVGAPAMTRFLVGELENLPREELGTRLNEAYNFDDYPALAPVNEIVDYLLQLKLKDITRANDLVTLHLPMLDITINESEGFSPVERRHVGRDERCVASTEWKEISDVWVPSSFLVETNSDHSGFIRYQYDADWLIVNDDVPYEWFDFRQFPDIKPATRVVDSRSGSYELLGVWGERGFLPANRIPKQAGESDSAGTRYGFSFWMIIANALLIAITVTLWARRRHRSFDTPSRSRSEDDEKSGE